MTLLYGKHFSHSAHNILFHAQDDINGNVFLVNTKNKAFIVYTGNLEIEDFYKIIPTNILSYYELNNNGYENYIHLNSRNQKDFFITMNNLDDKTFLAKMDLNFFQKNIENIRENVLQNNIIYTLFNVSSELNNLTEDKQKYLLEKQYALAKDFFHNRQTDNEYLNVNFFIQKHYMPSKHYSIKEFCEFADIKFESFSLDMSHFSNQEYNAAFHNEFVNALYAYRDITENPQEYDQDLYNELTSSVEIFDNIFSNKLIYENILLDYYKLLIQNNKISEDDFKKINRRLYSKYQISKPDNTNEFSSISSFTKHLSINVSNLVDKKSKMLLINDDMLENIQKVVDSYIIHFFPKEKYDIKTEINGLSFNIQVTTWEHEFNEDKKLMQSLLLALDFISNNLDERGRFFYLNLDQLNPSLRELDLNSKMNHKNIISENKKKI